ncbi:16097_t:CDS:1 [Funneliformis geosporum]|uniref:7340_t:CDS:1 n=1 Tax=Funneliformis geosporum TaxID=1117311 RepID=A0A9W4SIJ8_9GLOM|nr:16097_t:CDS:1 [Funneliformis geosporum]CAI2170731.1 7340_t:CDS:1 [Funneliformis geosporum]
MSSRQEAPMTNYSYNEIENSTAKATKDVIDYSKQAISSAQDKASRAVGALNQATGTTFERGFGVFNQATETTVDAFKHPIESTRHAARYAWENFPPLSWFGYGVAALNSIPLAMFVCFFLVTLALVLGVAGTGILAAEGFFLGLGSLFFVPTVVILSFAALSTALFTVFGWSLYKAAKYSLCKIGLVKREIQHDSSAMFKGGSRAFKQEYED